MISEPIYRRVKDAEGNISEISQNADQISARLSDAEGNISSLTLTSQLNSSRLSDAEGNISSLTQTATSLSSRISNTEGDVSNLTQTTNSLTSRISNTEGEVSSLSQTVGSFSSRISNAEGEVSSLSQTVGSFSSRISNAEGSISNLTQTANSLTSRISNTEGEVSSLSQTVGSFSSRISSVEGDVSSISQTVDSITLSVTSGTSGTTVALLKDGVVVSSGDIVIAGYVTFTDLSTSGNTTINGDNITTGTINVDLIKPNNGLYVDFSHPIAADSMNSLSYVLGENAEICIGRNANNATIRSAYPGAIVMQGTTILSSASYICSYRNGGYEFHPVLTSANIADYLDDLDVVAKFG